MRGLFHPYQRCPSQYLYVLPRATSNNGTGNVGFKDSQSSHQSWFDLFQSVCRLNHSKPPASLVTESVLKDSHMWEFKTTRVTCHGTISPDQWSFVFKTTRVTCHITQMCLRRHFLFKTTRVTCHKITRVKSAFVSFKTTRVTCHCHCVNLRTLCKFKTTRVTCHCIL